MIEVAYRKRDGKEKKEYTKEREREREMRATRANRLPGVTYGMR